MLKTLKMRLTAGAAALAFMIGGVGVPTAHEAGLRFDIAASAESYGNYTYSVLSDGTVEITKYNGNGSIVSIPSAINGKPVSRIGNAAFYNCQSITTVTIPDGTKSIGVEAFRDCHSLEKVTIGNSVSSIENGAFNFCTSLTSINFPSNLTKISEWVFANTALAVVKLPESVESIDDYAFYHCESLERITLTNGLKSIGASAFVRNISLQNVFLPYGVKSIGESAFSNCTGITNVYIPNSVTSIGSEAFLYCTSLESVSLPNSVTSIGSSAFRGCTSVSRVTIPDSVVSIGIYAFGFDDPGEKISGFTICCYKNTAAETYAKNNSINYVLLNDSSTGRFSLIPSSTELKPGDVFTIEFSLDTNPGINSLNVDIGYDSNSFELTKVTNKDLFYNPYNDKYFRVTDIPISTYPYNICFTEASQVDSDYNVYNFTNIGTAAVLTFKVKTGASEGSHSFTITQNKSPFRTTGSMSAPGEFVSVPFDNKNCTVNVSSSTVSEKGQFSLTPSSTNLKEGDEFTVDFALDQNPGINAFHVNVVFDTDAFELTKCTDKRLFYNTSKGTYSSFSLSFGQISNQSPFSILWTDSVALDSSNNLYNYTNTGTAASLTFKVKNSASAGSHSFTITQSKSPSRFTGSMSAPGSADVPFDVQNGSVNVTAGKVTLTDSNVTVSPASFVYNGSNQVPSTITVKVGDKVLVKGTDYTVSYSSTSSVNVGTYSITVTGLGNYEGSVKKSYTITAKSISGATISLNPTSYTYDGTAKTPTVTVKDGTKTLSGSTDYTVSCKNNTNAGTATVTVTGKGNYKDTATKTFTISPKSISGAKVTLNPTSYTYDGSAKKPTATVTLDSKTLVLNTDYTVEYTNNVNVGTATAKVTGKGNYTGSASATFTIAAKPKTDISKCTITLNPTTYVYDGTAKKPTVTVKNGSTTLTNNTDYTVAYSKNTNVGTAVVTVTGIGDYTGTKTANFTITAKSISGATVTLSPTSYIYDGSAKTPTVTVKDGSKTLTSGTDYTVSCKNNTNAGTATVTVTGKSNYKDTATKTFTINAKSIAGAAVTLSQTTYTYDGTDKKPTVTVKDGSKTLVNDTDYTVKYPTDCKNTGSKTITITGINNYTGKNSKIYLIQPKPAEKKPFVWGRDNWNFINTTDSFTNNATNRHIDLINSQYVSVLKKNLNNKEYERIFDTKKGLAYSTWKGSCYGMAALEVLSQNGLLPYSNYKAGATDLYSLKDPKSDDNIRSLITYYMLLQKKDVILQDTMKISDRTNEENIKQILSLLDNNDTVLVCFFFGNGGHAVTAYGYEYGSFTKNKVTYQGRILICDPNSSKSKNENRYIYFNTKSYSWCIPDYEYSWQASSKYGAFFGYISADPKAINNGGYLSDSSANSFNGDYVARLDAAAISDNRTVKKVSLEEGNYEAVFTAPEDIVEKKSYILEGESGGTIGYNLYDPDSAYQISQATASNLSLIMDYENCTLTADSYAGKSVTFDKSGYVEIESESADYSMSMTFNNDYPTDWFTIDVNGSNANKVSLEKADKGWIVSADNLKDVEIRTSNKEDSAYTKLSTDYPSILVCEVNKSTIGIKLDTDNNGTYETEYTPTSSDDATVITVSPKFDTDETNICTDITLTANGKTFTADSTGKVAITGLANGTYEAVVSKPKYAPRKVTITVGGTNADVVICKYGDANSDGKVNDADIALLQQYLADWKVTVDSDAADATADGNVNDSDVALLQQYLAEWKVTLGKAD